AIGRAATAEVTARRSQLDRELKRVIEEKVAPWGITILSVEIRDILMPKELQEAMSIEAQAEQRRKARIALMEAEQDISDMLKDVVENYGDDERAMRLRAMHLLYEGVKDAGGAVVIPSAWGDSFGEKAAKDLGKHMVDSGLL
ncbi:MAG: SPFH domain-containing protein, partial [Slackia sp.]